jgi:16S rRNA (guanine527-N7)-methyltransferase
MNLPEGIAMLGLTLPDSAEQRLERLLSLLAKWNGVYNLTAIRDPQQMVTHHLLDSLTVLPYLKEVDTLVDIGSGAGLPGLVLAASRPDLRVASIEASQKKAAFQLQAKIDLGLTNVSIHCCRAEVFKGDFDIAISRAFAELTEFAKTAGHLTRRLFAMKGAYPEAELSRLPSAWHVTDAHKLAVPGMDAERHLIVLERT